MTHGCCLRAEGEDLVADNILPNLSDWGEEARKPLMPNAADKRKRWWNVISGLGQVYSVAPLPVVDFIVQQLPVVVEIGRIADLN